ncbi:hypothetical protein BIY24_06465 [Halobacteriovorax marinus]|uniref:sensor histidine kinase n=1 Tax=Halobacteriovorax marinus TaxID=97084 RepID=UPI000BC34BEF|nr:ATP-binding protein [Halobacteriovorax marinus]ATH07600.1 hypothetical protein BIY24_06465 [Halobacteriovorax marinus]
MQEKSIDSIREYAWKRRATILGLSTASAVLLLRFLSELIFSTHFDKSNYIIICTTIVLICQLIYVKKTRFYETSLFYTLLFAFIFIYARASMTGGLTSPTMAWYPVVPIISSFLLPRSKTIIIGICSVIFIVFTSQFSLVHDLNLPETPLQDYSRVLVYISVTFICTVFCLFHEDQRKKMRVKLEEQRLSILSSARNTELGELAAGIAHEINNPLAVIKVKSKKIKALNSENKEVLDSIEKISAMAERINKIVKSMKNLSKNQVSQERKSNENFEYIFDNVLTLCETKMKYSNIQFQLINNVKNLDKYRIPIQLGHVLLNIINNAYDAVLIEETKWIKIFINTVDELLEIKISNSGKLIDEDKREKIFNPFYSDKDNRTGLGLSISKNNLSTLGGELKLLSDTEFTTFSITLPLKEH